MNKKLSPWADIHCHTQQSDGTASPSELIAIAKNCGLKGLSITDHDTIAAYAEATPAAQALGIHLGSGVEFSCMFEGYDVHILGYDFKLESPEIKTLCQKHHERRHKRYLSILEKLRQEGFEISQEELEEQGRGESIGRPHIAQIMVKKGYVGSIKEAFNQYLGEGKKCYVRGDTLTVQETIQAIHAARGKAFIAHPHLLMSGFPIDQLLACSFDGIECWYAKLSQKSAERWVSIAKEKGWLMSGGSDFHGAIKPDITLGCQGIDKATFYQIFEHPLA